ncbi:MAG: septal ring lytic transglycosylase RlpA family protein [Betaproteobacteria bacterium]|nr:MAG: septal ring lytic transglycosylase RlpA family protein [Betaproteobacteria bacterium]
MRLLLFIAVLLAGCASAPPEPEPAPPPAQNKGGYYKDDGPQENPPQNLADVPDAEPKVEPLHRYANRPYQVFGRNYVPLAQVQPFRERGLASWYGKRFHGQPTASGEVYDMYAMTAAHPTLPIPSYVRVKNLASGRSVVVRVNDRGPFHPGRIIDLSYAAAFKLGLLQPGSAQVELEAIVPGGGAPAVYVQVGAFSSRENAESLRARFTRELTWVKENVQLLLTGNLWRLHVGPYRSREDARSIAERIESELNLKPLIVVR